MVVRPWQASGREWSRLHLIVTLPAGPLDVAAFVVREIVVERRSRLQGFADGIEMASIAILLISISFNSASAGGRSTRKRVGLRCVEAGLRLAPGGSDHDGRYRFPAARFDTRRPRRC